MKSKTHLTSILVTAISLSHAVLGMAYEVVFTTPEEVDAYVIHAVENIHNAVEQILYVPSDEQTFDNTFRVWNRLNDGFSCSLKDLASLESPQIIQDFYTVLNTEVFQNIALREALIFYAQKASRDETLNPYQHIITDNFLQSAYSSRMNSSKYIHLRGAANEEEEVEENLMVFNSSMEDESFENISRIILDKNFNVICLKDIKGVDNVYALYDALKDKYSHFYLIADFYGPSADSLAQPHTGLLIASKQAIDNPEYLAFSKETGFADLTSQKDKPPRGYLCAAPRLEPSSSCKHDHRKSKPVLEERMEEMQSNLNSMPGILANAPRSELETSLVLMSARSDKPSQVFTATKEDEGYVSLCRHKESVTITREKDDDGKTETKFKGSYENEKNDYYVRAEAEATISEKNGKREVEGEAKISAGRNF